MVSIQCDPGPRWGPLYPGWGPWPFLHSSYVRLSARLVGERTQNEWPASRFLSDIRLSSLWGESLPPTPQQLGQKKILSLSMGLGLNQPPSLWRVPSPGTVHTVETKGNNFGIWEGNT